MRCNLKEIVFVLFTHHHLALTASDIYAAGCRILDTLTGDVVELILVAVTGLSVETVEDSRRQVGVVTKHETYALGSG